MAVKLELYRVFKEVAETGNISLAAKNLYISQSAVSQSIKQLETALQARLFARSPRGVSLTWEGQMLYQYVRSALGLLAPELTARQVADRHMAAVFRLDLYKTQDEIDAGTPSANASGFFIMSDGLAVTNYHSIADAVSATATLSTGDVYEVERVIYYDPDIDIAVIRVSHAALKGHDTSAFATLDIADSGTGDLRAGDTVYAIGNPLGLGLAVSSGIVSATQRDVERYALPCVMSTADISEGSSGGALLNVYGQAVAVTSGAYVYGNSMYLAVPIDPILTADLTGEGLTLPEVLEAETVG